MVVRQGEVIMGEIHNRWANAWTECETALLKQGIEETQSFELPLWAWCKERGLKRTKKACYNRAVYITGKRKPRSRVDVTNNAVIMANLKGWGYV